MDALLFAFSVISIFWGIVSMSKIVSFCRKRGIKINWFFFRIYIFKYVSEYKKITAKENGKPGFWFYSFILSMNIAALLVITGLIIRNSN